MNLKKTACFLLTFALFAGSFAGCSNSGNAETEPTALTASPDVSPSPAAETEAPEEDVADARAKVDDELPERDMEGAEFCVLTRERSDFVSDLSFGEELNGDVVNDAIVNRNIAVSERFDIALTGDYKSDPVPIIQSCVKAGDDSYSVCLAQIIGETAMCYKGGFLDWYTALPYVDLNKPWYIGNAAEALSVKNHAYVMIGEFDLDVLRFTYCMYYNKDLAATYSLEDIYPVVREGRWTYDTLKNLSDTIYTDLDGNGVKDENDILAISGDPFSAVVTYQYSFDNPLFTRDSEGVPQMTFDRDKAHSIVEKLNALVHPAVRRETERIISQCREEGVKILVLEAALLIEQHYDEICDELWYIYAGADTRMRRLAESRGYSKERIEGTMAKQLSDEEFRAKATFVLDNDGDFEYTKTQIDRHFEEVLR